ncbi:tagaturonate reductase [Paenibacillus sp. MWE-103]|uniref:Tagaturonate reductase n=1 Tax=Paenibacillus artemisiicola TaxID=1172618 RepID=A0ABS3WCA8_9BACL|nr:tagaturonate reductase [Paenibacillus artemisiicola]MBO7745926.1 tagaturonate reductase [Paenibacillus artemisiicola]
MTAKVNPGGAVPGLAQLPEGQAVCRLPVKVLQFGEGNFLRGFVDWMVQRCNAQGLFGGGVAVTQPRPAGKPNLEKLKAQRGAYTLLVRGLQDGRKVEEREIVSVFARMIDPYEEWDAFLALADSPELEFVVSNTTEAGLAYQQAEWNPGAPVASFPGKLTVFLYRRFVTFAGDPERGLVHLPCELLERNGDLLLNIVLRHADDWRLSEAFKRWVRASNRFVNTLVDRIVTGYPREEADGLFAAWGYSDPLLATAEPYHLWAIQATDGLESRLPLAQAGLNVRWVEDLTPYQLLKVRILNGAHTMMATLGLADGLSEVREAMEHPAWGEVWERALRDEVLPGLPLPRAEADAYVSGTLDRFRNPYIRHRLTDIAMNSLSKWRTRLLPSLKAYAQAEGSIPVVIARSLAALIWLYRPRDAYAADGAPAEPRDDETLVEAVRGAWAPGPAGGGYDPARTAANILRLEAVWGEDLTALDGLAEAVAASLAERFGRGDGRTRSGA